MSITFEKNAYFQAMSSGAYSSFEGTIQGKFISPHKCPTLQTFQKCYTPDGWILRKIVVIPAAIYSGLIQSIYHVALSIFTNNKTEKEAYRALARMDRAEGSARIASLFWDEYGLLRIQQAQFYKTCLHLFLKNGHQTLNFEKIIGKNKTNNKEKSNLNTSPTEESSPNVQKTIAENEKKTEIPKQELDKTNQPYATLEKNNKKVIENFNNFLMSNKPEQAKQELKKYQVPESKFATSQNTDSIDTQKYSKEKLFLTKRANARVMLLGNYKLETVLNFIKDEPIDDVKIYFLGQIALKAIEKKEFNIAEKVAKMCEEIANETQDIMDIQLAERIREDINKAKNQK